MKRILCIALFGLGCAKADAPKSEAPKSDQTQTEKEAQPFKDLSIEQVEQKLAGANKPFVFDANPEEVYRARHLPGAVWVPESGVTASLLPKDKSAPLIFYCANTH